MKLPALNQSGIAHLALILILLASITAGTLLVQERTQLNSRADEWWNEEPQEEEEQQEEEPQEEEQPEQEPEQPEPEPEPEPEEPAPEKPQPEEPPVEEEPETPAPPDEETPPQGGDDPETPTPPDEDEEEQTPPDEEIITEDPVDEEEPGLLENLRDSVLDVTDGLGLTSPDKEHEEEIENAEDEGTKIKNRLVTALNDPENADKNKSDLKSELGLDPEANDEELFDALRTAWAEQGITVSGDSFEDFTVYTGQGELVALANTGAVSDATDVAMGLGTGCAGSSLGVVQTKLVCGPSDFAPAPSGPSQSVGIKVPTEEEQPYCNEVGGFQPNCKPVPEKLPECNSSGGYQEACVQNSTKLPECTQGFQTGCVIDTSDLPICADQGFQSNCVYVPKPVTEPSNINPACLDPKKFLDPSCANGGTGPITNKPAETLGRQIPVVIIDDTETDNARERLRLEQAEAREQSAIEAEKAKIEQYNKSIEQIRELMAIQPETQRKYSEIEIKRLEQEIDTANTRINNPSRDLQFARAEYGLTKDPEIQARNRELDQKNNESLIANNDATQRASNVFEWANKNVDGFSSTKLQFSLDEDPKVEKEIKLLEEAYGNKPELQRLIQSYKEAKLKDEQLRQEYIKTSNETARIKEQKLEKAMEEALGITP